MIFNLRVVYVESRMYVTPEEAKKYGAGQINFNVTVKNPSVVQEKTPFGEKSFLRVDFDLTITYLSPNIGYIRFEGKTDYVDQKLDVSVYKETWEGGEDATNVKNEIANTIIATLSPIILTLARTHDMPSPFQIPVMNFKKPGILERIKKKPEPTGYHT